MRIRPVLFLAVMIVSPAAFGQLVFGSQDGAFQVGYAANLNIGDSVVNLTNDGANGGFFIPGGGDPSVGNICVNTYVFDPQEEEIGCCACLVTPNGLNSLSAKSDLISNNLTPAVPTSIVIKLVASTPSPDPATHLTLCNPATVTVASIPFTGGMMAWGTTLEPNGSSGTYGVVLVPFLQGTLSPSEFGALTQVCNFIQSNGTGFGICKSCRLGGLAGAKQ